MKTVRRISLFMATLGFCSVSAGCAWLANNIADQVIEGITESGPEDGSATAMFNLLDNQGFKACLERKGVGLVVTDDSGPGSCTQSNAIDTRTAVPWPVGSSCPDCLFSSVLAELGVSEGTVGLMSASASADDVKSTMAELSGKCDACARGKCSARVSALCVLSSDEHRELMNITTRLAGVPALDAGSLAPRASAYPIEIRVGSFQKHVDLIRYAAYQDGTEQDGFGQALLAVQSRLNANTINAQDKEAMSKLRYISEYLKAYFRDGGAISYKVDFSEAREKAKQEIIDGIPGIGDNADNVKLIEDTLKDLFPEQEAGKGEVGFVSRGGSSTYQFSGVNIDVAVGGDDLLEFEGPKESPIEIANILLRLVIEGSFDAVHRLPAVAESTAVVADEGSLDHPVNDTSKGKSASSPYLTEESFNEVERWGNTGDGVASSLTGKVIRGVSWLSLNNEALAGLIETYVGVAVRKVTEKTAYCAYSCLAQPDGSLLLNSPGHRPYAASLDFSLKTQGDDTGD